MIKFKKRSVIFTIILIIAICCTYLIPTLLQSKELVTRTINADEIGQLSYEEKAQELLDTFDVYSYDYDDSSLTFEGMVIDDFNKFDILDYLSYNDTDQIVQKMSTHFDIENELFTVTTSYYKDDVLIDSVVEDCVPIFSEEENDYYVVLNNGKTISVSESLQNETIDDCIAITASASLLAAALAITVVAAAPTITKVVTTVVTTVVSWVRSFFWWIKSLFVKTTVTTVVEKVATPSLTIGKTKYKTEAKTYKDIQKLNPTLYFAAFADPTNGKMYLTCVPISKEAAVAILYSPFTVPCIGDSKRTMVGSTYTFKQKSAYDIACVAGLASNTIYNKPDKHGDFGYFAHYHTNSTINVVSKKYKIEQGRPHSFFGTSLENF